jgi:succinoglycan biosynthesis transport protein ExoP
MRNDASSNDWFAVPANEVAADGGAANIDIREIWAAIYRSRFWIVGIFATVLAIVFIVTLLTTRLYDGTASVEVRQEAEKVLGTEDDREGTSSKIDSDRFLQTQLDIIRSRAVSDAVAQSLSLYRNNKFIEAMGITEEPKNSGVLSPQEAKREQILEALRENLSVTYTGDTRIVNISFSSPSARLSAQIANAYAESFIRNNLARKFDTSAYALEFLRDQLTQSQARLEKAEQAAVDAARRTGIIDVGNGADSDGSRTGPKSLTTEQLILLNESYSRAVAQRIAAEEKWSKVRATPLLSITEVLSNQAIQGMIEQRSTAEADYEAQLTNRRPDHPSVQQANSRVRELDKQISTIARNIRESIKSQYTIALAEENKLASRLGSLKTNTLAEQGNSIQLSILQRDADTNRAQYESLLKRYNELNAEAGVQSNNLTIVDRAQATVEPSWPKWPLNIAVGLIVGALLSVLFIIVREQLFDVVRSADDVRNRLRLALLGIIPATDNVGEEITDPKSVTSEAFSSMRTSLSLVSDHGIPKSIMFTSSQAGEGKSSTCYALGTSFARLGMKVLIIDVDLRRPNAHNFFGIKNDRGTSDVLSGQTKINDVIVSNPQSDVDILPAGKISPNPTELVMGGLLQTMIEDATAQYDVVLIDSAPVLGIADALILSSKVEATIFVIESGRTGMKAAQNALSRLMTGGGHIIGVVLTKFDASTQGDGYEDYSYKYKYESRSDRK